MFLNRCLFLTHLTNKEFLFASFCRMKPETIIASALSTENAPCFGRVCQHSKPSSACGFVVFREALHQLTFHDVRGH